MTPNAKTPHAMNWGVFPFGECGKEVVAAVNVRLRFVDPSGDISTAQIVEQLRNQMADVLDCSVERINTFGAEKGQG